MAEGTDNNIIRHIRGYDLTASEADYARTYYHYASDEMESITHVADGREVLNHYEYDVWGNLAVCEETVPNRFLYTGQQRDPITRQYYLRARYYNPVIACFTQEDTYRGDGLNLYAYCRNNPVCHVDPSGHCSKDPNGEFMPPAVIPKQPLPSMDSLQPSLMPEPPKQLPAVIYPLPQDLLGGNPQNRVSGPAADVPNSGNRVSGSSTNGEAHNVVNYAKLKEQYTVSELANNVVDSLTQTGSLPSNYITKSQAKALGWSEGKALNNYAPGSALGGDIFNNTTGILPQANGRIWYEADVGVDYTMSRSNSKNPAYRILYSNDGLIYGTFDHYGSVFQIYP